MTLAPYDWFESWSDQRWGRRGADYQALKEKFSKRLLGKLLELEPQLDGTFDHIELSTPLSTQHFCNYERGEIYGLEHNPGRFGDKS